MTSESLHAPCLRCCSAVAWSTGSRGVADAMIETQRPAGTVWHYKVLYGLLGRLHASSRCGCAPTGPAQPAAKRAQASHVAHSDQTPDAQDDRLFLIDPDA